MSKYKHKFNSGPFSNSRNLNFPELWHLKQIMALRLDCGVRIPRNLETEEDVGGLT